MSAINFSENTDYAFYGSPYFALSLCKSTMKIAHLGIESGGRTRRHMDFNLLKPGIGASPFSAGEVPSKSGIRSEASRDSFRYFSDLHDSEKTVLEFSFPDARSIKISLRPGVLPGESFFSFSFGNSISPASVWGASGILRNCFFERI